MWLRGDFQGDSVVKNLPAEQEFGVCSLCLENSLEKKVAMHSSILAWEIPWTGEPHGYSPQVTKSQTQLRD